MAKKRDKLSVFGNPDASGEGLLIWVGSSL